MSRRRWPAIVIAAVAVAGLVAVPSHGAGATAAPRHAPRPVDVPPPDQRVYVVSESVGLSAKGPIERAFPADWQVTFDGTPALFVEQLESKHVRTRLATSPWVFGTSAVVAAGHNYPYWDPDRFDRSIDSMIATLRSAGVTRIYWVTVREVKPQFVTPSAWRQAQPFAWYLPLVNQHLRAALARHPDLTLIDWAAVADRPGITYDAIHLNAVGAQLYAQLVRDTVIGDLHRPVAGQVIEVPVQQVPGAVTGGATGAVSLGLTVTSARAPGFLTAYPCGTPRPLVSNANFVEGDTVAASAIVPVGASGTVCVFTSEATHVVVDASGGFPAGSGFVPVTPSRLVDTRDRPAILRAGEVLRVPVAGVAGLPADVRAAVLDVTATGSSLPGFVTVTPCGTPPAGTSNVNVGAGATVPNLVVVAPGDGGAVCLTANVDAHLVVDVFGGFAAGADVGLVAPRRLLDTRDDGRRTVAGGEVTLQVGGTAGVPVGADGVLLNLTAASPGGDGFLTAYPCSAGRPTASQLNVRAGVDRANFVLVAPDATGRVCVFTSVPTDVVVDLMGWVGTSFRGITPTRLVDTRS